MKFAVPSPLLKTYGILTFKLGADVLPKSRLLLGICLFAFAGAVFLFEGMYYSPARAVASGAGSAAFLSAVTAVWAWISGYPERLMQTLTALALGGAGVVLARTLMGLFIFVAPIFAELPDTMVQQLEAFLLFPLWVWNVYVFGFLLRRSFRVDVVMALAGSTALVVILYFLMPVAFRSL